MLSACTECQPPAAHTVRWDAKMSHDGAGAVRASLGRGTQLALRAFLSTQSAAVEQVDLGGAKVGNAKGACGARGAAAE